MGITGPTTIYRNLTFQELFDHEVTNKEGQVASCKYGETFTVDTGRFTGRSPKDKWIVKNPGSESERHMDWGKVNQPTTPEVYKELYEKAVKYMNTKEKVYVFDGFCGANPKSQKKIRFVHELAWQQHFVTNMFIRPTSEKQIENFEPDYTIINCCSQVDEDWKRHGLNSEVAVVFNVEEKTAVIFGTWYGGENKKGIFSLMVRPRLLYESCIILPRHFPRLMHNWYMLLYFSYTLHLLFRTIGFPWLSTCLCTAVPTWERRVILLFSSV